MDGLRDASVDGRTSPRVPTWDDAFALWWWPRNARLHGPIQVCSDLVSCALLLLCSERLPLRMRLRTEDKADLPVCGRGAVAGVPGDDAGDSLGSRRSCTRESWYGSGRMRTDGSPSAMQFGHLLPWSWLQYFTTSFFRCHRGPCTEVWCAGRAHRMDHDLASGQVVLGGKARTSR